MKLSLILCAMLVGASVVSVSRHARTATLPPVTPFDEYGNICWENEQARLDNFAIQLHNDPELMGYIVVYAGRISCRDEAKYRGNRARNYVVQKRGADPNRVIFKDGGFQPELQTALILRSRSSRDYEIKPTLSKDQVSIKHCVDKVFAKVLCLNNQ